MYKELYNVEIGEVLLRKLRKFGLDDAKTAETRCPVVLQAFSLETTRVFKESGSDLPRIQLLNQGIYNFSLESVQDIAHGVGVPLSMIFAGNSWIHKTDFVEKAHAKDLQVMAYTFRDDVSFFGENPREMYLFSKDYLQLDAVFTEFCDVALTVYQTQQQLARKLIKLNKTQ